MKFLKAKTLSKFSPTDQTLFSNLYGRAVMEMKGALRLPKGTTAQRPNLTGVRTTGGPNGFIRYNTDHNWIEAYVGGTWEVVRAPGASAITKMTLGPGDYTQTLFGPLEAGITTPESANNILVLVENVLQISDTNYTLVTNPGGHPAGTYLQFASPVPLDKYITILSGFAD